MIASRCQEAFMSSVAEAPVETARDRIWRFHGAHQSAHRSQSRILLVVIVLCWTSTLLPWEVQACGWGLVLTSMAVVAIRWRGRILGPVLPFDLVRATRSWRSFFLRGVYALLLLAVLSWVYRSWFGPTGARQSGELDMRSMAAFAERFFQAVVWVQFLAVACLTPVYVAGAIAEEKERRTLEYLLATDLEDREIVLGKLVARLANLSSILLAALPVLAIAEVLGGIDPALLVGSFVLLGLMAMTLGSLSLLVSVYAKRLFDALFWTLFWVVLYLLFSFWLSVVIFWLWDVVQSMPGLAGTNSSGPPSPPVVSLGNPLVFVMLLQGHYPKAPNQMEYLAGLMQQYALAHLTLTAVFTFYACRKLREIGLRPEAPPPPWQRKPVEVLAPRRRKKMGDDPLHWKEVHGEALLGSAKFSAILTYLQLVTGWCLLPVTLLAVYYGSNPNGAVASIGAFFGGMLVVTTAAFAAATVSRERERQTLESLLVLPLETDAVLRSKWLGALLSVRPMWWCLGAMWLVGFLFGALNPLALVLLPLAWCAHAALLTSIGLWFSVSSTSAMRATLQTLVAVFLLAVGLRLMADYGHVFWDDWLSPAWNQRVASLFASGLAPFASLSELALPWDCFRNDQGIERMTLALMGCGVYLAAAALLWKSAALRFRRLSNRTPMPGRALN